MSFSLEKKSWILLPFMARRSAWCIIIIFKGESSFGRRGRLLSFRTCASIFIHFALNHRRPSAAKSSPFKNSPVTSLVTNQFPELHDKIFRPAQQLLHNISIWGIQVAGRQKFNIWRLVSGNERMPMNHFRIAWMNVIWITNFHKSK